MKVPGPDIHFHDVHDMLAFRAGRLLWHYDGEDEAAAIVPNRFIELQISTSFDTWEYFVLQFPGGLELRFDTLKSIETMSIAIGGNSYIIRSHDAV